MEISQFSHTHKGTNVHYAHCRVLSVSLNVIKHWFIQITVKEVLIILSNAGVLCEWMIAMSTFRNHSLVIFLSHQI